MSSGTSVPRPRTCRMIRAALHGVHQHRVALDVRRRWFHTGEGDGHANDDEDADGGVPGLPEPFSFEDRGVADDIRHESPV